MESPKYLYNEYDIYKGKKKNEILQRFSVPDRRESDGENGEILVYEERKLVTNSSTAGSSYYNSNTNIDAVGASVYGSSYSASAATIGSKTAAVNSSYSNTNTVTKEEKKYVNFFINSQGICYRVNANCGDVYTSAKYQYKWEFNKWHYLWLIPPFTVYIGIPAIITAIKAKRGTLNCP